MRRFSLAEAVRWGGGVMALAVALLVLPEVLGQQQKKAAPKRTANTQLLDVKAQRLQNDFTKQAEDLASEYFEAGSLEKAKSLLQSILALEPERQEIQQKLKIIEDTIISSNEFEVDVNAANPQWEPVALLFEGRPIRIKSEGSYRWQVTSTVGPAGYPTKDPIRDMAAGLPCGALIGMVVDAKKNPGRPFLIGEGTDFTPKTDGILLVRVNTPPDSKNNGRLKVTLSGYVRRP